ncbi:transcription factor TFIIIC subunit tfc4, partial [Chytridiales sp. JEL 0842]
MGEADLAKDLLDEVDTYSKLIAERTTEAALAASKKPRRKKGAPPVQHHDPSPQAIKEPTGFFNTEAERKVRSAPKLKDPSMKKAEQDKWAKENMDLLRRMEGLYEKVKEPLSRMDYLRTARQLLGRFQGCKAFYPASRAKQYSGVKTRITGENGEEVQVIDMDYFEGLTFDEWYETFIKYAITLVVDGKEEEAFTALQSAYDANVFYHNLKRRNNLRLHMIASAMICGNYGRVVQH